jgi:hypothetical protein
MYPKKAYSEKQVISHFEYIKQTDFKGRFYTIETLAMYTRAKTLGIDLNALGLEPKNFVPKDISVLDERDENYISLQKKN